jgi:hypothetical protein
MGRLSQRDSGHSSSLIFRIGHLGAIIWDHWINIANPKAHQKNIFAVINLPRSLFRPDTNQKARDASTGTIMFASMSPITKPKPFRHSEENIMAAKTSANE